MVRVVGKQEYQCAEVESCGAELVWWVRSSYNSNDSLVIARCVGIEVVDERWPLVTVGEFDRRTGTILVNLAALEINDKADEWFAPEMLRRLIVAHELGHFFFNRQHDWAKLCVNGSTQRIFSEAVAHEFAVRLTGTPYTYMDYERRWREQFGRKRTA